MLRRVSQNFAAQVLGILLLFADRLLVVGILLRAWGPQTYADWALLLSTAGMLSLGELSLNIYFGNIWQKAHAEDDSDRFRRMVSVALACSLTLGCLLGAVALVVLLTVDLPRVLSISALSRVDSIAVLCLLAAVTLSRVVKGAISQIYRGRQAFARGIVIDQFTVASLIVLTVTAGLMGATPLILAVIYLTCELLVGWGVMIRDLSRRWPDLILRPRLPTSTELHEMWRHVMWFAVLHGVTVSWVQLPVVLLGYIGKTGNALVSFLILRTLANLARQIATMIAISSGVEIAAVHHAGHSDDVAWRLKVVGRVLSVLTAALAVAVALYGESFVVLWTGHSSLFDWRIAVSLFGAILIAAPSLPLATFGLYGNSPKPLAIAGLVQIALGLSACAVLAARYGAPGAAAGLAIGEGVAQGIVLPMLVSRHAGLEYFRYVCRCVGWMALTIFWCGGVGLILGLVFDPHTFSGLLASGLLWGAIGFVPALAATLPASQRTAIARRLRLRGNESAAISKL